MPIRQPLREHLIEAWHKLIEIEYSLKRINSERSLQAAFWAHLNANLPKHFCMFIEPPIQLPGTKDRCYPDIVICNSRSIIAVVELKYRPLGPAAFRKDIRNLNLLAESLPTGPIEHSRYLGPIMETRKYHFSSITLFAWAGFFRSSKKSNVGDRPLFAEGLESLKGRFLQLTAETQAGVSPKISTISY